MTRFARAKGSKASNERREEEATPWHVMRQQLADKLSGSDTSANTPSYDVKTILASANSEQKEEFWSDFGETKEPILTKPSKPSLNNVQKNKKRKLQVRTENITKETSSTNNSDIFQAKSSVVKKTKIDKSATKADESHTKSKLKSIDVEESNPSKNKRTKPKSPNKLLKNKFIESEVGVNQSNESKLKIKAQKECKIKNTPVVDEALENQIKDNNVGTEKIEEPSKYEKKSAIEKSKLKKRKGEINLNLIDKRPKSAHQADGKFSDNYYGHNMVQTIYANDREIKVVTYEGFLVKVEDAKELQTLRKKLKAQNIPQEQIKHIMKLERRKAEKALAREKTKVCFHCRKFGHKFSDCPEIDDQELAKSGMCFKCGSTEHAYFECKVSRGQDFRHAVCFVCKEQGHIARQCPLNPQGQYPKGGSCHLCGEVTHLRKDCPKAKEEQANVSNTVSKFTSNDLEEVNIVNKTQKIKKKNVVKF